MIRAGFLSSPLVFVFACRSTERTSDGSDYAAVDAVGFSRATMPYSAPEGVYVYDLVADDDGFTLLADWTDTRREPPSIEGLLHLDPTTGEVDAVTDAVELGAPSNGGVLARTDGPLVAVLQAAGPADLPVAVVFSGGDETELVVPLEHVYAAAVSEGHLIVAGLDRTPCARWRDWCPRILDWDLDSDLDTGLPTALDWPDLNQATALLPAEDGFEFLSVEAYGRYHRSTDAWETFTAPVDLTGFTKLSDTERLFFRGEAPDESQPVIIDVESGEWRQGCFTDGSMGPVRLSAERDGQTWVLDAYVAADVSTPTLSIVSED